MRHASSSPETLGTYQDAAIVLSDGRKLGYREAGDPSGYPVLFFHGLGASRAAMHPDAEIARALGVRLIAPDRPGIGLSDPMPTRTLLGWAKDVEALADALDLDRFAILGHSGGGAHALACARELPERVERVGIASGGAPIRGPGSEGFLDTERRRIAYVAQFVPWLASAALWQQGFVRDEDAALDRALLSLPLVDRGILSQPEYRAMLKASIAECLARGSGGMLVDALVLGRPWGFASSEVDVPVRLWHGDADTVVPLPFAQCVSCELPKCESTFSPGEGHFLYLPRWGEMLGALKP